MAGTASHIRKPALARAALSEQSLWLAALLSLGAAGIHFAVAREHLDEYWLYGWFFIVAAWLQGVWAIAVVGFGPNPRLLLAGLTANVSLVALWLWTRLIGVPLGPDSGDTEAFAWVDGVAVACELGVVILASIALRQGRQVRSDRWTVAFIAGLSMFLAVVVGVVLENDDGGSHADEQAGEEAHE
ncbi:MAG: hypothetical protein ACRDHF_00910 [Tepidiformaceae bacterium]